MSPLWCQMQAPVAVWPQEAGAWNEVLVPLRCLFGSAPRLQLGLHCPSGGGSSGSCTSPWAWDRFQVLPIV
jgi:hypothetical protein